MTKPNGTGAGSGGPAWAPRFTGKVGCDGIFRVGLICAVAMGVPPLAVAQENRPATADLASLRQLPGWHVTYGGADRVQIETTIAGWPVGEHCLDKLPTDALAPIDELGEALLRLDGLDDIKVWLELEGTSDALPIDRHRRFHPASCAEIPAEPPYMAAVDSPHAQLGLARATSVWAYLAKDWHAARNRALSASVIGGPRDSAETGDDRALLFARSEPATGADVRLVRVTFNVRAEHPDPVLVEEATREEPPGDGAGGESSGTPPVERPRDGADRPPFEAPPPGDVVPAVPGLSLEIRAGLARVLDSDHYVLDLGLDGAVLSSWGACRFGNGTCRVGGRFGVLRADHDYRVTSKLMSPYLPRLQLFAEKSVRPLPRTEVGLAVAAGLFLPASAATLDVEVVARLDLPMRLRAQLLGTASVGSAWSVGQGHRNLAVGLGLAVGL